eukprot:13319787-Heterocapsa_arctica.AAC.1
MAAVVTDCRSVYDTLTIDFRVLGIYGMNIIRSTKGYRLPLNQWHENPAGNSSPRSRFKEIDIWIADPLDTQVKVGMAAVTERAAEQRLLLPYGRP